MKVAELIEQLKTLNPETEVRIAYQPNYPLTSEVESNLGLSDDEMTVYIGQSADGCNEYLNEEIAEQLWR